MDEPTACLDFGNQALVLREVRALAAQGYGIILSTHDPTTPSPPRSPSSTRAISPPRAPRPRSSPPPASNRSYGVRVFVEHLASGHTVCAPDLGAA